MLDLAEALIETKVLQTVLRIHNAVVAGQLVEFDPFRLPGGARNADGVHGLVNHLVMGFACWTTPK